MVSQFVGDDDLEVQRYVASKLYDQLRNLKSKPECRYIADYHSIFYSVYWLAHNNNLVVFKKKDTESIVGVLAFSIDSPWYTRYTCLNEIFVLQTDPSYHGFGRKALEFFKETAKENGCVLIETGASMTDESKILENLYKRHGKCTFSYPNFVWVLAN